MVSVPYGVIPCRSPAANSRSHSAVAYHPMTFTSYASSPEKLTLAMRTCTPSSVESRHAMKGNASLLTSTPGNRVPTTSRDFGPTTGNVCHCSVTDVNRTRSCGHSVCSHSSIQSRIRAAPPVRSEEHTSELQSLTNLVCRLLLEKKKK